LVRGAIDTGECCQDVGGDKTLGGNARKIKTMKGAINLPTAITGS